MSEVNVSNLSIKEKRNCANGRRISIIEGFIQTIGINIGGIFVPNFILTAFLLSIMHASNVLIGFVTSLQFIVGLLQPFSNILIHKLKHRKPVVAVFSYMGRFLFILAIFIVLFVKNESTTFIFVIIMLLSAVMMSFCSSGWGTWMADIVPENIRGNYFSIRNSLCSVAGIIAILTGGLLLKSFSENSGFIIIYAICFFSASMGFVILLFQYEPEAKEHHEESLLTSYKNIFKDKNFLRFVRMAIFFNFALLIASPFYNVLFLNYFKIAYDKLALITAGAAIFAILGNIFFGKISDIIGNRAITKFALTALILQPLICLFIPKSNYLPFVIFVIIFAAFFLTGWNLALFNSSLSISPKSHRSLYLGIFTALNATSAIIAPIIGGILIDLYKTNPFPLFGISFEPTLIVFILSSILLLIGLIIFPDYQEDSKSVDFSMRELILRPDFLNVLYKIFISSFISYIPFRHKITEDIGDTKSPMAIVPLEKLINDMDYEVRISAIEGLGKIGSERALYILLDYFEYTNLLEKKEIIKALKNFNHEDAKKLLLKTLENEDLLFRAEAIHSLCSYQDIGIKEIALKKIKAEKNINMFIMYLELLSNYHVLEIIPLVLKRYAKIKDIRKKEYMLYHLSVLLGIRKEFYHFISIDNIEEQESKLEDYFKKIFDVLKKNPNLKKNNWLIKEINILHDEILCILSENKITTLNPYKFKILSLFSKVILTTNPNINDFMHFFFSKTNISFSEIALLFLEIIKYLNIRYKMR